MLVLMGVFVGGVASILGVGGGIFIVPLLPIIVDIGYRETVATSLMTIFLIVLVNSYSFHKKSLVRWKIVLMMGPCTALGSYVMAHWSHQFSEMYLRIMGIVVITLIAMRTLWISTSQQQVGWMKVSIVGVVVGGLSGFTGIGSGSLLSPLLLNWRGIRNVYLTPTVNGIMIFTTFFGVLSFFELPGDNMMRWGWIHMDKVLIFFVPASISTYWGRRYQNKVRLRWRSYILGGILIALAFQMVVSL